MIQGEYTEPDILMFKKDEVQKVASREEDDNGKVGKLMLVGSDGVYFMNDHPMCGEQAFAEGCNPSVDEFDDWWALKGATWGGDDGCIHWDAGEVGKMLRATFASANGGEWEPTTHLISSVNKKSITLRPHR